MDKNPRQYHRSRSASTGALPDTGPVDANDAQQVALLAQLAALTGLPQLPQNFPQSPAPTSRQPFPSSVQHYMQQFSPGLHPLGSHQELYGSLPVASSSAGPSSSPYSIISPAESSYASTAMDSPTIPSPSASAEIETNSDTERAVADDKRRRNTEASARFRIKKKLKAVNLERLVTDLTGRAEELEREVADLRRENGWLKEIIMLKGTQLAALNLTQQLEALHPNPRTERRRSKSKREGVSESSDVDEEQGDESGNEGKRKGKKRE